MKITIDTKEDSHDEIKRIITMLKHLVGENAVSNAPKNIFESSDNTLGIGAYDSDEPEKEKSEPTNAFSAMFGDNSKTEDSDEAKTIDLDEEASKDDDESPEVMEY